MPRRRLTRRKYREPREETRELRRGLYRATKAGPITATALADRFDLTMADVLDEIDVLENFGVLTHQADDMGVIRWHPVPNNPWEGPPVPF